MFVKHKQKEGAPEEFSPIFNEITKGLGLLFVGYKIVIPKNWQNK